MAAITFDPTVESQVVEQRERVAKCKRPGRLCVAPPHAWRIGARNRIAARIDSVGSGAAIAERGKYDAICIDFRRQNAAHEEVTDGIAFAILCLSGASDELQTAEALDLISDGRELRVDFPA